MRYAVYFCPDPGSALDTFGRDWLAIETVPGIAPARLHTLLADVRRYGWHATLAAPAALKPGTDYDELRRKLVALATCFAAFELPLQLDRLAGFLALRPAADAAVVHALAEQCLRSLHPLRAPLAAEAISRRAAGLDAVELARLSQYGYPYVLDRYRFHMTLAAPASAIEEAVMRDWLESRMSAGLHARVTALTICRESEPGADFEPLERIPLHVQEIV